MDIHKHAADIKELQLRNRRQGWTIFGLIVALLLSNGATIWSATTQRVVVTPATVTNSFWVSRDQVSREYLEMMGGFVAWLVLDVTPASVNWKKEALLNIAAPEAHGKLKIRQEVEAARLKRLNASTDFEIQRLTTDVDSKSVVVAGRLRTLINGKEVTNVAKTYVARFGYSAWGFDCKGFEEKPSEQNIDVAAAGDGSE